MNSPKGRKIKKCVFFCQSSAFCFLRSFSRNKVRSANFSYFLSCNDSHRLQIFARAKSSLLLI
jgi:hypothetical protein